jgi:hypothetical protein
LLADTMHSDNSCHIDRLARSFAAEGSKFVVAPQLSSLDA